MEKFFNYLDTHETSYELFLFGTLTLGSLLIGMMMNLINSL